jgi:hypothetical protein
VNRPGLTLFAVFTCFTTGITRLLW